MLPRNTGLLFCCVAGFVIGCEHGTAPGPVERITLQFCAGALPDWVAFQNEGSNWARATISPDGTLPLDVTDHVAIATVHLSSNGMSAVNVRYTSAAALTSAPFTSCPGTNAPGTKTVTGSVMGLAAGQDAGVAMGTRSTFPSGSFSLSPLPDGALDLVAHRRVYQNLSVRTDRIVVRRGLDVATGSILPVIDFASSEAVAPAINTVTLDGLIPGDVGHVSHAVITANGTNTSLFGNIPAAQTLTSYSLPASVMENGDRQLIRVELSARTTVAHYTAPADMTITLGAPLAPTDVTTLSSTPTRRFRVRLDRQADYSKSMYASFTQGGRLFSITVTDDYYSTPPATWEAAILDFRGVEGWQDVWGFVPGTAVNWLVQGVGPVPMNNGVPVSGSTYRTAYRTGSI